ncbi:MAG: hypothetical protein ACRDJW_00785 [Thermomicrobiales bacterium]
MLLKRIVAGGPQRKTRFHDEEGNLIELAGLAYAPLAWVQGLGRVAFHRRPNTPWLSHRAINELDRLIQQDWYVIEFGSGMSTPWLAERCGFLYSVESDPVWSETVRAMINERQLTNVRYEQRPLETYADLTAFDDDYFNLALVDGEIRSSCLLSVFDKLKPNGFIYLDNSDWFHAKDLERGINPRPKEVLLQAVEERGGTVHYFVDFVASNFIVGQGMLAQLP